MADGNSQYSSNPVAVERINHHRAIRKRVLGLRKSELVDLLLQFTDDEEIAWILDEE